MHRVQLGVAKLVARFPLQRHLTRRTIRRWFAALTLALAPGFTRPAGADVQFVDLDNDGDLDLLVTNREEPVRLF